MAFNRVLSKHHSEERFYLVIKIYIYIYTDAPLLQKEAEVKLPFV